MGDAPRYFGLAQTSIDQKNRITVPAKFRNRLPAGEDGKTILYVMIGQDFRHLELFDSRSGKRRVDELTGGAGLPDEDQRRGQGLLGFVEEVELDRAGRIRIPKAHAEYARLTDEVVVSGAGDHMRLYDPAEATDESIPVNLEKLDPQSVARIYNSALKSSE